MKKDPSKLKASLAAIMVAVTIGVLGLFPNASEAVATPEEEPVDASGIHPKFTHLDLVGTGAELGTLKVDYIEPNPATGQIWLFDDVGINGVFTVLENSIFNQRAIFSNDVFVDGLLEAAGRIANLDTVVTGTDDPVVIDDKLEVTGDAKFHDDLKLGGALDITGVIETSDVAGPTGSGAVVIDDNLEVKGPIDVDGAIRNYDDFGVEEVLTLLDEVEIWGNLKFNQDNVTNRMIHFPGATDAGYGNMLLSDGSLRVKGGHNANSSGELSLQSGTNSDNKLVIVDDQLRILSQGDTNLATGIADLIIGEFPQADKSHVWLGLDKNEINSVNDNLLVNKKSTRDVIFGTEDNYHNYVYENSSDGRSDVFINGDLRVFDHGKVDDGFDIGDKDGKSAKKLGGQFLGHDFTDMSEADFRKAYQLAGFLVEYANWTFDYVHSMQGQQNPNRVDLNQLTDQQIKDYFLTFNTVVSDAEVARIRTIIEWLYPSRFIEFDNPYLRNAVNLKASYFNVIGRAVVLKSGYLYKQASANDNTQYIRGYGGNIVTDFSPITLAPSSFNQSENRPTIQPALPTNRVYVGTEDFNADLFVSGDTFVGHQSGNKNTPGNLYVNGEISAKQIGTYYQTRSNRTLIQAGAYSTQIITSCGQGHQLISCGFEGFISADTPTRSKALHATYLIPDLKNNRCIGNYKNNDDANQKYVEQIAVCMDPGL